jgi:catechol 2,3-dioxygenase-like lactoylglutathione lyase family enzyme
MNISQYDAKRQSLKERYLDGAPEAAAEVATNGVDHLALIFFNDTATTEIYTTVLDMHLTKIVPNRDEPTSTHIFLDMGGGNLLAFFDFPTHGPDATVRGVGSMHHVALKATPEKYQKVISNLKSSGIDYSIHGSETKGAVYLRDPDNIMLEVTTGYD